MKLVVGSIAWLLGSPYAPCTEYLPTCFIHFSEMIGKNSIHMEHFGSITRIPRTTAA